MTFIPFRKNSTARFLSACVLILGKVLLFQFSGCATDTEATACPHTCRVLCAPGPLPSAPSPPRPVSGCVRSHSRGTPLCSGLLALSPARCPAGGHGRVLRALHADHARSRSPPFPSAKVTVPRAVLSPQRAGHGVRVGDHWRCGHRPGTQLPGQGERVSVPRESFVIASQRPGFRPSAVSE